jgi:hypothetical protein
MRAKSLPGPRDLDVGLDDGTRIPPIVTAHRNDSPITSAQEKDSLKRQSCRPAKRGI